MNHERGISAAGYAVVLMTMAGCTPNDIDLGGAAKHNYALQVIDPEPVYEDDQPAADGTKAAAAYERYRTDKVKKPVNQNTTSGSGSGSDRGSNPN